MQPMTAQCLIPLQLLPNHPHSLMASGGYAGEANQSGSDASLDSIALMDLYEDATRQDYEDAVRSKSTAHQKGGGSIDSGGRPANRDATNEASGGGERVVLRSSQ